LKITRGKHPRSVQLDRNIFTGLKTKFALTGLIFASLFFLALNGAAQVNSWTNPASGNWHDPSWSLGVLPNSNQWQTALTNAGWKAVAINRTTALNHPSSLSISDLFVTTPIDSFNTLMLNFAGREWPLRVGNSFYLGVNSAFLTLDSALQVAGAFIIDGTVTHTDYSEVSAPFVYLGNIVDGPTAYYNLTNGILTISNRFFVGPHSYGIVRQHGGSNRVNELRVGYGAYELHGGSIAANTLKIGSNFGFFDQYGGTVVVTNPLIVGENDGSFISSHNIWGQYLLTNGTLRTPAIRVGTPNDALGRGGAEGRFIQYGGSNITTTLQVGAGGTGNTFHVNYILTNGWLLSSSSTLGPGYDVSFSHSGGSHLIDGPLNIRGVRDPSFPPRSPNYGLWEGALLRSRSVTVSNGLFFHIDGTNEIAGDLLLAGSSDMFTDYILLDGCLTCSNTIARVGRSTVRRYSYDRFRQDGGVHVVAGVLDLAGPDPDGVVYEFSGGQLIAPHIRVANGIFVHYYGSGVISNPGTITLAGAHWEESASDTSLGALRLDTAATDSIITFYLTPATLRFLSSAGQPWAPDARLVIQNWNGSTSGGGSHRIIFGNSGSALTAQQLRQIRFRHPAGFPSGDYPARILSTGEIVAAPRPSLVSARSGSRVVLQWPAGYTLQTAANISGPFSDINTSSPYDIQPGSEPQRYFRLRQ
jgi:hypothetical protein